MCLIKRKIFLCCGFYAEGLMVLGQLGARFAMSSSYVDLKVIKEVEKL